MSPAKYNRYANTTDITVKDKSVISKKTIEQMSNSDINALISMGKEKRFFDHIPAPMLATLVDKPFDAEGWLYEIKWDGYRTLLN